MTATALACVLAGAVMLGGCSIGDFAPGGEPEADTSTPGGDTGPVRPDSSGDTVEDRPDTAEGARPPVQGFQACGAGGVAQAGGVQAIQCYGPWEPAGAERTGGGVRWQPGTFRVISDE